MNRAIADAWLTAAVDLGIAVTAPARLTVGDQVEDFDALIEDFGSQAGTAVVALGSATPARAEMARTVGVFLSELSGGAYEEYDRTLFIDTLRDWGWFGEPSLAPDWLRPTS